MLSLSTQAAPALSLAALDAGARARGLDGLELAIAPGDDLAAIIARARSHGTRVIALRLEALDATHAAAVVHASGVLGVPISIPAPALDAERVRRLVPELVRAGCRLLLGHRMTLDAALAAASVARALDAPAAVGLAWELHPADDDLSAASAILLATGDLLGAVRLHGGGPEQRDQDGRGVGSLFVELALSGFAGPIILCPSRPELIPRWTTWLDGRGSSGCGHAVSTRSVELDVRDVEPRHRLETILGAYRTLIPGATLHLTVDHDPVCMYYMLEATEPAESFAFQIVEHGPETWRAEVTRR